MLERFGGTAGQESKDEGREEAFDLLKKRETELLKTNEAQIKLAQFFYPEESTLEDMMMRWATSEEKYSEQFRKILESEPELLERLLRDDESVIEEIANRMTQ